MRPNTFIHSGTVVRHQQPCRSYPNAYIQFQAQMSSCRVFLTPISNSSRNCCMHLCLKISVWQKQACISKHAEPRSFRTKTIMRTTEFSRKGTSVQPRVHSPRLGNADSNIAMHQLMTRMLTSFRSSAPHSSGQKTPLFSMQDSKASVMTPVGSTGPSNLF